MRIARENPSTSPPAGGSRFAPGSAEDERLPVRYRTSDSSTAFRAITLQAGHLQIGAIEPDLAQDLRPVAAAQNSQHVVARGLVVDSSNSTASSFRISGHKQCLQQMLRAQIFDRLVAAAFHRNRPHAEICFSKESTRETFRYRWPCQKSCSRPPVPAQSCGFLPDAPPAQMPLLRDIPRSLHYT